MKPQPSSGRSRAPFSLLGGLSSLALLAAALLAMTATSACGGNGDDKDSDDGDGDGDGDGNGAGGTGDGDGDGAGGTGNGDGGNGNGAGGTGGGGNATAYDCDPAQGNIPLLTLEEVEDGFDRPVLITHAPSDPRLFVVEQDGLIRIIENGAVLDEPFLDLTSAVNSVENERGLLGLAFHPNYTQNGLFYVYYTADGATTDYSNGASILAEYSVSDDPNLANPTERVILDVDQPASNHNGGQVAFGPDGMLYLALGDGGNTPQHGQNETLLLGSLLRIDIDGRQEGQYSIPAGNLSEILETAAPEVFSYGFRNPYRYNFDACTGDLYIGDVGQNLWEEVTITASGVGQLNYGWNTMEGLHCYSPMTDCDMTGLTMPQIEYSRGDSGSVVGGTVYRGSEIPGLRGKYFYADAQQTRVWYTQYNSTTNMVEPPTELTDEVNSSGKVIVSIQNGHDGEIYMSDLIGGAIYKLVAQ